jgi:hypothetical protein
MQKNSKCPQHPDVQDSETRIRTPDLAVGFSHFPTPAQHMIKATTATAIMQAVTHTSGQPSR